MIRICLRIILSFNQSFLHLDVTLRDYPGLTWVFKLHTCKDYYEYISIHTSYNSIHQIRSPLHNFGQICHTTKRHCLKINGCTSHFKNGNSSRRETLY